MLSKLKTALVLLLIGAVSGGLIYIVNDITAPIIFENELQRKIGFYSEIFEIPEDQEIIYKDCTTDPNDLVPIDGQLEEDVTFEVRDSCPEGLTETFIYDKADNSLIGVVYFGNEKNSYGEVGVLVGINIDGTIANVVISSSTNTVNFVKKIEKEFLSPFMGQLADPQLIEFDSATGATYTYGSVTDIVNDAIAAYNEGSDE